MALPVLPVRNKTDKTRDRRDEDGGGRGTDEMGGEREGGLSNPGFPSDDVSSWPMSSIKLTSVSQTFPCVCLSVCICVCVYTAILHDSDAAGLLCVAQVDVQGQ